MAIKTWDTVRLVGSEWDDDLKGTVHVVEGVDSNRWGTITVDGIRWWVMEGDGAWGCEKVRAADGQESHFSSRVREILADLGDLLIEKNNAYGNSALDPVRVFSKADTVEQLNVRLDDKLSRIKRGHEYANEDTLKDILGYIVLLMIAKEGAE